MTLDAKIIQVILTTDKRGMGTPEDKVRHVQTLWTLDGEKICEIDPTDENQSRELHLS